MTELKITQVDEDAMEAIWITVRDEWMRTGLPFPTVKVVGAFARHRIAAEEGKAELVEALELAHYYARLFNRRSDEAWANADDQIIAALARVQGEG